MYRNIKTIIAWILKGILCIRTQSNDHMTDSCQKIKNKKIERFKVLAQIG